MLCTAEKILTSEIKAIIWVSRNNTEASRVYMCTDTDLLKEKTEQVPAGPAPPPQADSWLLACAASGPGWVQGCGRVAGVLGNSLSPCSRGIPFLAWCNQFIEVQRDLWPGAQTGPCLFLLCPPAEEWLKKKVKGNFSVCNILLEYCPRHSFNVWPIAVWGGTTETDRDPGPTKFKIFGALSEKVCQPDSGSYSICGMASPAFACSCSLGWRRETGLRWTVWWHSA